MRKRNELNFINIFLISQMIFFFFFRYIYGGRLSLEEHDTLDIIKILVSANGLILQDLIPHLQSFLIQISENQVWENVLKLGLSQNPELPSDPEDFSKEDFNALKNSLQQCIPFIRFYNLSSEEFSDRILPYKKILPKELYKDLLKYFLNPNNQSIKQSKPRVTKVTKETSESITSTQKHPSNQACVNAFELYKKAADN